MADFSLIQTHPDVEEIINKLISGTDPKSISDWLKLKYPDDNQTHLLISIKLLKEFQQSEYLNYYDQAIKDLNKTKNNEKINKKLALSIQNNKTYQERLNEVVDKKIDILEEYKKLRILYLARIEQLFDKIQEDPDIINSKNEYVLTKYTEQFMGLLEKMDKIINNRPDQIIQHNHVVDYVNQYTAILQQTVLETFKEIDSESAFLFMEKYAENIKKASLPEFSESKSVTDDKILKDVQILNNKLLEGSDEQIS